MIGKALSVFAVNSVSSLLPRVSSKAFAEREGKRKESTIYPSPSFFLV
jgi:hypothetical protein